MTKEEFEKHILDTAKKAFNEDFEVKPVLVGVANGKMGVTPIPDAVMNKDRKSVV